MDKAAIFTGLTERNALRREHRLPPLDPRTEYDRLVALARWQEYAAVCDVHAHRRREIAEAVLAEFRATRGPGWGASAGGRWMVNTVAQQRFEAWLAVLGHVKPPHPDRNLVRYGTGEPG